MHSGYYNILKLCPTMLCCALPCMYSPCQPELTSRPPPLSMRPVSVERPPQALSLFGLGHGSSAQQTATCPAHAPATAACIQADASLSTGFAHCIVTRRACTGAQQPHMPASGCIVPLPCKFRRQHTSTLTGLLPSRACAHPGKLQIALGRAACKCQVLTSAARGLAEQAPQGRYGLASSAAGADPHHAPRPSLCRRRYGIRSVANKKEVACGLFQGTTAVDCLPSPQLPQNGAQ